jgi:hypothetical protein
MINQLLGSPVGGGIVRLYLRLGAEPSISEAAKARSGSRPTAACGYGASRSPTVATARLKSTRYSSRTLASASVANASLRQRNAYFSSSDARLPDRYKASAEWERVKRGDIAVDGGWRIYSSGPGLYVNMLIRYALGQRRYFGERISAPLLPRGVGEVTLPKMPGTPFSEQHHVANGK